MDELEKKIPVDSWRKTFDDAAETPPPRVWDAIERRLDESTDTKIVPLWGLGIASSRPLLWGTGLAAAVTLLLVGWWINSTPTGSQPSQLLRQKHVTMMNGRPKASTPVPVSVDEGQKNPAILIKRPAEPVKSLSGQANAPTYNSAVPPLESQADVLLQQITLVPGATMPASDELPILLPTVAPSQVSTTYRSINSLATSHMTTASFVQNNQSLLSSNEFSQINESSQLKTLKGKAIHLPESGHIYRTVWFQPAELPAQPEMSKSKQKNRTLWASASVMPGTFNPMISVQTVSAASSYTAKNTLLAPNQSQPVTSQANFSVAYQASAGKQLTDRWSIEMGVGYLAGRSMVDTPVQLLATAVVATNAPSQTAGNLYVDALRNSTTAQLKTASLDQVSFANNTYPSSQPAYTSQNRKVLTNDYQFVQLPVQVGYQLRPRKRLNLAVLGGIISNIFVRNTVDNEVVVTAKDGVYRPVSFAAIMGARFRYQYTPQWSASLVGMYQPSIGLVTQAHAQVQSQPTTAGMTLGVDYHF